MTQCCYFRLILTWDAIHHSWFAFKVVPPTAIILVTRNVKVHAENLATGEALSPKVMSTLRKKTETRKQKKPDLEASNLGLHS